MTNKIPTVYLDDLCSRFLVNIPETMRSDMIAIFFEIERAHWHYLDYYCMDENSQCVEISDYNFAFELFNHCPYLTPLSSQFDTLFKQWRLYKRAVPTYGAILLDSSLERSVLVQGFYGKSWGFPKGKVNENEDPCDCARREILEEIGYDISAAIDSKRFVEARVNEQMTRLFIVTDVDTATAFRPRTRREIKHVGWFSVHDLPKSRKDRAPTRRLQMEAKMFYMVVPFMPDLCRWIAAEKAARTASLPLKIQESQNLIDVPKVLDEDRQKQAEHFISLNKGNLDELFGSNPRESVVSEDQKSSQEEFYRKMNDKLMKQILPASNPPRAVSRDFDTRDTFDELVASLNLSVEGGESHSKQLLRLLQSARKRAAKSGTEGGTYVERLNSLLINGRSEVPVYKPWTGVRLDWQSLENIWQFDLYDIDTSAEGTASDATSGRTVATSRGGTSRRGRSGSRGGGVIRGEAPVRGFGGNRVGLMVAGSMTSRYKAGGGQRRPTRGGSRGGASRSVLRRPDRTDDQ